MYFVVVSAFAAAVEKQDHRLFALTGRGIQTVFGTVLLAVSKGIGTLGIYTVYICLGKAEFGAAGTGDFKILAHTEGLDRQHQSIALAGNTGHAGSGGFIGKINAGVGKSEICSGQVGRDLDPADNDGIGHVAVVPAMGTHNDLAHKGYSLLYKNLCSNYSTSAREVL